MELYDIKIKSEGNGWHGNVSAAGRVTEGERLTVKYTLDGDECELSTDGITAVQSRRGGQNVFISFARGEYTQCVIGQGGMSGSYKIFTRKLKLIRGAEGFFLLLEYLSGNEQEKIKLTFTAIKNKKTQEFK